MKSKHGLTESLPERVSLSADRPDVVSEVLRMPPNVLRRKYRREATRWLDRELPRCHTEAAVLCLVLAAGRYYGILAVRFHRLGGDGQELVSIDSAGHSDAVARLLRDGSIRKRRDLCPLDTADSFQCFNPVGPTVFQVVPGADAPLREIGWVGETRLFEVAESQCESSLGRDARPAHADIPLVFGDRTIGKLSCGLAAEVVTDRVVRRVERFRDAVRNVAARLAELHRVAAQPLRDCTPKARDGINAAVDLGKLFDYAVSDVAGYLGTAHASLYTFHTDDLETRRLVLRRTTDPDNTGLEDGGRAADRRGYFAVGDRATESLAAWVAGRRRPLRFQALHDPDAFCALLRSIDPGLAPPPGDTARWSLGRDYRSYLAVPLLVGEQLLGVLELTDKGERGAAEHYTHIDEGWLMRVATNHLAPRLNALLAADVGAFVLNPNKPSDKMAKALATAIGASARPHLLATVEAQLRMIAVVACRAANSHVSCLLDRVTPDGGEVVRVAQADTRRNPNPGGKRPAHRGPYAGSLAARLERKKSLFVHDAAPAEFHRDALPQGTMSVVACPVVFDRAGGRGTLTVVSDRFDLTPETHVPLLKTVVEGAAEILGCKFHDLSRQWHEPSDGKSKPGRRRGRR